LFFSVNKQTVCYNIQSKERREKREERREKREERDTVTVKPLISAQSMSSPLTKLF
jgi:hypothetical protein